MNYIRLIFTILYCLIIITNPLYSEKVDSIQVKGLNTNEKKELEEEIEEDIKQKITDGEFFIKTIADKVCECVDSIDIYDKTYKEVNLEIADCIEKYVMALQMQDKLLGIEAIDSNKITDKGDTILVEINSNKESKEYGEYYMKLERYLMENCESVKTKLASNEKRNEKSLSDNQDALNFYSEGIDYYKLEDYKSAIKSYRKALTIDSNFAFAWDNLGLCYRLLEDYDEAIKAYKKSIEIDPTGLMPLQNLPIAYMYKGDYENAILAYNKLKEVEPNNPEIFYGLAKVYLLKDEDYEKALDYMCKAYNIYIIQKSPYRTDAENFIAGIYQIMKEQNKEEKFDEILKLNNIKTDE